MKRLFSNFISLSVVQILSVLFPIITFPYLLRTLGVKSYGELTLIQTTIMYADSLVSYGFGLTAAKRIAKNIYNSEKVNNIITSVFIIKLFLFLSIIILFLVSSIFFDYVRNNFSLILISFMYILGNILFPDWYFQGIQKMWSITVVAVAARCISFLLIVLLVKKPTDIFYAVLGMSVATLIAGLTGFVILITHFRLKWKYSSKKYILILFKESTYVFSSIILVPLYSSVNIFILRAFSNPLVVGYYAIAEKIFNTVSVLTSVVNRTIYPHLSQLYKKSKNAYEKNVKKISLMFFIVFSIFSIIMYFAANIIITIVSGRHGLQNMEHPIEILKIMSLAVVFSPFGSYYFQLLIIQNKTKVAMKNLLSIVVINLFTANILAYLLEGKGMAINLCIVIILTAAFNYFSFTIIKNAS